MNVAETDSQHKSQALLPAHGQNSSASGSAENQTEQKVQCALPTPESAAAIRRSEGELAQQEAQGGGSHSASHERKLSGGSSKGSMSGNPYAGSCMGSHAGSTGGSPCDSHKALSGGLQHELSGEAALPRSPYLNMVGSTSNYCTDEIG